MYHTHSYCRACGFAKPSGPPGIKSKPSGESLVEVFNLGVQPLANDFCNSDEEHSGFAPLKVLMCPRCNLAQLSVVVDPRVLYSKYSYVTSTSNTMREHFASLWKCIRDRQPNCANVLEIGSNDGTLLDYLRQNGAEYVIGIDPAENLTAIANEKGVISICGLFDKTTADVAARSVPKLDAIIARHVFCHVDDWDDFITNLGIVAQKDTLVVIEVPYVMDLLRHAQFDTIYHEHLSFLNIRAMEALLSKTMFKLDHIQHFPVHGGAIAIYLRRRDFEGCADDSVEWYLEHEKKSLGKETWDTFGVQSYANITGLRQQVLSLVSDGKTVFGFGASAKSTVWVNACGFTRSQLRFITDTTPQKQWKFSPGSDIPIVDEGALLRDLPDYAVMFAWNFRNEILTKHEPYLRKGGHFIIPVPKLEIVGIDS